MPTDPQTHQSTDPQTHQSTDPQTPEPTTPQTPQSATAPTAPPVPVQGDGTPDYSHLEINTEPPLPAPDHAGGSATEPESGGGYSG